MNALVLVDLQNDFLPGGALAVPHGDEVLSLANRLMPLFKLVVATQDWHPANHGSFASQHPGTIPGQTIQLNGLTQILWPDHCVQGTRGAEFAEELDRDRLAAVFHKGTRVDVDSYSGFYDNAHRYSTGLGEYLRERHVRDVYLAGLATDYCVKFSALDARHMGFRTYLVQDACRAVELRLGDTARALECVRDAGVEVLDSTDVSDRAGREG
jgi:nicotinamidase/pyrazinamidase